MGQSEIIEFLNQNKGKKYSTRELAGDMGVSVGTICVTMRRLRHHKLVKFEHETKGTRKYFVYWRR